MSLAQFQADMHNEFCRVRNLDRLYQTTEFVKAYGRASPKQLALLDVIKFKIDRVKVWIQEVLEPEIDSWSVARLRKEASKYSVYNYGVMSRSELIFNIKEAKAHAETTDINNTEE